jgi:histidine triad (HIT) family protein
MSTLFSKIIAGEIPSYQVAEDDYFYAFLDINPLAKGHTLVVPKKEIDYLFDLEDEWLGKMSIFAKHVARGIDAVIDCERVGVVVLGMEIPHAHIHLIPINDEGDIDFKKPKLRLEEATFQQIASDIQQAVVLPGQ